MTTTTLRVSTDGGNARKRSMVTPKNRAPRFGPLFYSVLTVAVLLVVGFFGWQTWRAAEKRVTTVRYLRNLRDADAEVRQLAVEQLSVIGADYSPVLIELLDHEDGTLRLFACEQLGALRPLDETALGPLTRRLTDTDPVVRCYAAHAIAPYATIAGPSSDEEAAIRQLCVTMHDHDVDVRRAAAYALADFGRRWPVIVATLKAALNDEDPNVRLRAAWSLYEIDHDHLSLMIPVIENVMSGDNRYHVGTRGERCNAGRGQQSQSRERPIIMPPGATIVIHEPAATHDRNYELPYLVLSRAGCVNARQC